MLHQIGVGALGPVYRTYEPTRDRLVAVKVFRLDITPEQSRSLADELATAADAGLFHPSVVEPIASGVEGTLAYRAEEYVAAETLDVAMRHYAPAPAEKMLPFITQLAGAVDFARAAGVGHGALHPRDVFLTPDEARATGFGVVEALERVGLRAPVRRPYSAPERVAGQAWSTPADVFSLGVIGYEMLTGRRPAGTGVQIGALSGAHADALHAVLARAMDEDPSKRFPTALAFAEALDAASRGEAPAGFVAGSALVDAGPAAEPSPRVATGPVLREDTPEFDDVAAERDDDHAHFALAREETAREEATAGEELFNVEAIEDFAIEEPPRL
ncbi:MAG: protein kinase, partial [Vicinamibacterales bacterium]